MKVTLYLRLENFNDGDFDVSNNYYKSDDDFFDAMDKENKKYSNIAYDVFSNLGNLTGNKIAKLNYPKKNSKNASINNYKSEAILYNEDGSDETVDNLITNCFTNDVFISIIKYNRDAMDEEFEEDLNLWIDEHININAYKDKIGEEKAWENEPKRTFFVEFLNKANEKKYIRFENCRLLNKEGEDEYSILSEKITLVDSL